MDRNEKPPAGTGGDGKGIGQYTVHNISTPDVVLGLWNRRLRPVPCRGKKPYHNGWTTKVFDIRDFDRFDNVGVVLGDVIAIDIDILDPDTAAKVEALALKALGPSSCRVGRWPKRALLYRSTEPMNKTVTRKTTAGMVELLGVGQQAVVAGVHPDTQQPYRWRGAPPWSPSFELVTVTPEQVQQFLHDAEVLLGLEVEAIADTTKATATTPMPAASIDTGEMPRTEDLARALAGFWSADAYDDWTTAGLALTGHPQGRELWMAWSATSSKHTDTEASAKWLELSRSSRGDITAEKILSRVPTTELQAWGREHRIAELRTDPMVAHGRQVADAIIPSRRAAPEGDDDDEDTTHPDDAEAAPEPPQGRDEALPEHLLSVPGVLQDVVGYYNGTAMKPQPAFAVVTALALGSVAMGRRFVTTAGNFSSLYFLNVSDTSTGKEHARTVVNHLLDQAGLARLIGPAGYTSASGVLSALIDQPCHIATIDELGRVLQSTKKAGNSHKADAQTIIMEAFGQLGGTIRPQGFSKVGLRKQDAEQLDRVVVHPALTLLTMTTPSTLEGALSAADMHDGFLNRFLFCRGSDALHAITIAKDRPSPTERLLEWLKACATAKAGDLDADSHDIPPAPVTIPFTPEAEHLFFDEHDGFAEEIKTRQAGGPTARAMLGRVVEQALRISLIVSVSMGKRQITHEAALWAIDYARHYGVTFAREAEKLAAPSEAARWASKLVDEVRNAGGELSHTNMIRKLRDWTGLTTNMRDTVIAMAGQDHGLVVEVRKAKKGKAFSVYCVPTTPHRARYSKQSSSD